MSLRVPLQVVDLTADLRGTDPTRPVLAGVDGPRVVVVLDADHAKILGHLIARGVAASAPADGVDRALWDHATVDVLASAAWASGNTAAPVDYTPLEVVR